MYMKYHLVSHTHTKKMIRLKSKLFILEKKNYWAILKIKYNRHNQSKYEFLYKRDNEKSLIYNVNK